MQTTQPLYRLDYHGDDVPEYLSEDLVQLVLACDYPPADVLALLEAMRCGLRVDVQAGWLTRSGSSTSPVGVAYSSHVG